MVAFARANTYFEKANCKLLGLSIDSNPSHLAWVYDIFLKTAHYAKKIKIPLEKLINQNFSLLY